MYKITVIGLAGYLLPTIEKIAKIEYVDECFRTFTASFDGWHVKVKHNRVTIKYPEKKFTLTLENSEFEEISIK